MEQIPQELTEIRVVYDLVDDQDTLTAMHSRPGDTKLA